MKKTILAIAAVVAVLAPPVPAAAIDRSYVVFQPVTPSVQRAWDVYAQIRLVDYYAGSRAVVRNCRAGERCVKIYQTPRVLHPACRTAAACALFTGNGQWTIYLNPNRVTRADFRRAASRHEIAHTYGIAAHRTSGCNTWAMYYSVSCPNGKAAGPYFTSTERAILRRN